MCTLGYVLLSALGVVGVIVSDCAKILVLYSTSDNAIDPGDYVKWYWKLSPYVLYSIGKTIIGVLFPEFIIAQSPDKMKGLVN